MSCVGLSFTELRDRSYRRSFAAAGLKSSTTDLGDGTTLHCWVPAQPSPARPAVVLLHGFGANATWQWGDLLRPLLRAGLNVYVPDLLFFGSSFTALPHRTVSFQARCVARLMDSLGMRRASVAGISYGGLVAYCMAAQSPEKVEKLVICCSGVCLEERDLKEGLFPVKDLDEAASILVPQSPARLRRLIRLSFVRPPMAVPACLLADFIDVRVSNPQMLHICLFSSNAYF